MSNELKYYIYISDTKLDMLYQQIPKNVLKRLASELSINLKLVAVEIGASVKKEQTVETRYSKLKLITNYIEKHTNVGTINEPGAYFKGTLTMRWGRLKNSETIYFTGNTPDNRDVTNPSSPFFYTTLGLGGSLKHVIGSVDRLRTQEEIANELEGSTVRIGSSAVSILDNLIDSIQLDESSNKLPVKKDASYTLRAVSIMAELLQGPEQRFEFLSRTLLKEEITSERMVHGTPTIERILLGSPIYVSLAD